MYIVECLFVFCLGLVLGWIFHHMKITTSIVGIIELHTGNPEDGSRMGLKIDDSSKLYKKKHVTFRVISH